MKSTGTTLPTTSKGTTAIRRRRRVLLAGALLLLLASIAIRLAAEARSAAVHARLFAREIEQAAATLDRAPEDPRAAVEQAGEHLAAARAELEALRPLAEPASALAGRVGGLPLIGGAAREAAALWSLADSGTRLGEELLQVAGLALGSTEGDGGGLVAALPEMERRLRTAEASFQAAQAARGEIGSLAWLPAGERARLEAALARWDALAPPLERGLAQAGRLAGEGQAGWEHFRAFTAELEQAGRLLGEAEEQPVAALLGVHRHVVAARVELEALRPIVEPLLAEAEALSDFPQAGRMVEEAAALWTLADATTRLGEAALGVAEVGLGRLDEESGALALVAALPEARPQLQAARASLDEVLAARARLGTLGWLPEEQAAQLDALLARFDALAPGLASALETADRLAPLVPALLGSERPVTYLVLIQSSDELRATGGFITSVGTIRIDGGRVAEMEFREVTEAERLLLGGAPSATDSGWIQPPAPLMEYMGLGRWLLRDANWWADFPTTARQAADFWESANGAPVDGVIAINDQGLERLLAAAGPVTLPGGQVVSAENLREVAAERIYEGAPANQRGMAQSLFSQELARAVLEEALRLPRERVLRLARQVREAGVRRDLLFVSFDPLVAEALREPGIDGSLRGYQDDYLYLVEHNVSYNKLSPYIRQALTYTVELGADARPLRSTLVVDERNTYSPTLGLPLYPSTYDSGGRWDPNARTVETSEGYYGGYTRLYLPVGSRLTSGSGFDEGPEVAIENYHTVAGGYVGLGPGAEQRLQFEWLPDVTPGVPGRYRLLVQRQPGAPAHPLTVVVKLPAGARVAAVSPPPLESGGSTIVWRTGLDRDRTFSLRLDEGQPEGEGGPPPAPTPTPAAAPTPPPTAGPSASPPPQRAPLPTRLKIPALGVDAPIVPVGLEPSGIMASPSRASDVGWYKLGPRPGEPSNAILAGHVDWNGEIGVFDRLDRLAPGDTIEVQSEAGTTHRYVVDSVQSYDNATAPVAEIFGGTPGPVLTLITCTGPYDPVRRSYPDRLVVRARGQ